MGNMFFGQYAHTLDDKNRLMLPRKMRSELGDKVYILSGYDGCLSIYQEEDYKKMIAQISTLSFDNKEKRDYIRHRVSSTFDLEIDKAGRIQIPMNIITKYCINKEVMVIGVIDHIEVWDKNTYLAYEKDVDEHFEEIAEKINKI